MVGKDRASGILNMVITHHPPVVTSKPIAISCCMGVETALTSVRVVNIHRLVNH